MGLVRDLEDPQPENAVPDAPTAGTLLNQVADPDPDRRREAALGLDGVAAAVPPLVSRLAVETEPAVRDALLTTLGAHDNLVVAVALANHLASEDAGLRTAIAETLSAMPVSALSLMPGLLASSDHDVRVMTVLVLDWLAHPGAEFWLIAMIRDDPHPNVVTAAIGALLPSMTAEHVPMLRQAMERFPDDPFLRFIVATAVARLAGPPS